VRTNKYGIRGLKRVHLKAGVKYFWTPPVSLQKAGIFKYETLGANLALAAAKACDLNARLAAHREAVNGIKVKLTSVKPGSVGDLVRQFEASPRYHRYSERAQQDYSWMYRSIEAQTIEGRMFGNMKASKITRQLAYEIYEQNVRLRGHDSANKAIYAWQAAFRYGMLKFSEIKSNPFSDLDLMRSPPRRQRWTDEQLRRFIQAANKIGYPSIGRCALMCVELMQRPGDILSLKWAAYQERERVWHILQSKRGALVRCPETHRLRLALAPIRRAKSRKELDDLFVCGTITGKRWHRRNFTKTVRLIARAAGLPDDLQIRDLRRTAATEGASAGATAAEMMAIGGWANQASIRPYLVQTREQAAAFESKRDRYRSERCRDSASF
jgi:integrase